MTLARYVPRPNLLSLCSSTICSYGNPLSAMPCNDPLWSPKQRENGAPAKTFSYVPNWKLQFLVVLEFEYFDKIWKTHILSSTLAPPWKKLGGVQVWILSQFTFNFGPHWKLWFFLGFKLEYFVTRFEMNIFKLQLWAPPKILISSGVQPRIFLTKF